MEAYEEVKDIIKKEGNTDTVINQREKEWQSIADRLNARVVHNYTLTTPLKDHNYNPNNKITNSHLQKHSCTLIMNHRTSLFCPEMCVSLL